MIASREALARLLLDRLSAVLAAWQCPTCGDWYDPSDPSASHPHNNHPPDSGGRS